MQKKILIVCRGFLWILIAALLNDKTHIKQKQKAWYIQALGQAVEGHPTAANCSAPAHLSTS